MLVRVRTTEGTTRVEVQPQDTLNSLFGKISATLKVDGGAITISRDANKTNILGEHSKSLSAFGIKHGDMLYVSVAEQSSEAKAPESNKSLKSSIFSFTKQEKVDDFLEKQDGLIERGRDSKFCKHGLVGMCDYCMPLEPFDAAYLEENKIKHMSFQGYLKKLTAPTRSTVKPGSLTWVAPLDETRMTVNRECSGGHEPWPKGICTKCQPSAVTLQRQLFRMVDHVEFSSPALIENLLQFWRSTGYQRFGYLYGRYESYPEVPLGVKAVVETIYEPPQHNDHDSLELQLPWEDEKQVDELAAKCGLVKLGCIFTDLTDDQSGNGTVLNKRHIGSHFLSSQECAFAARMQIENPNACRWSSSGRFGSKFVTCVVSGQDEGGIDVAAYQASNTAMAMVVADLIEPSVDPSVMRVKDAADDRYVPEVFYKYKNEYGVTVQQSAKPSFPVDYLLVNVTHGFPQKPVPLFTNPSKFPIENRVVLDHQDIASLKKHLHAVPNLLDAFSDFHILHFIEKMKILDNETLDLFVRVATQRGAADANRLAASESWQTLMTIIEHTESDSAQPSAGSGSKPPAASATWSCRHCTFVNVSGSNCDMCGLPKEG